MSGTEIWTGLALREWAEAIADKIDAGEVWVTADLFHDGRIRDDVTFHVNKLTDLPELE